MLSKSNDSLYAIKSLKHKNTANPIIFKPQEIESITGWNVSLQLRSYTEQCERFRFSVQTVPVKIH